MDADCIIELADRRQFGAIMAGLRALEAIKSGNLNTRTFEGIKDIESDGGEVEPLSAEEISELCERINTGML